MFEDIVVLVLIIIALDGVIKNDKDSIYKYF